MIVRLGGSGSLDQTFDPLTQTTLELQSIFDRDVDLLVKAAIERSQNWLRRKNILESAQTIYATRSRISH